MRKLPSSERRDAQLLIRLTKAERKALVAFAHAQEMSASDWLRKLAKKAAGLLDNR